MTPGNPSAVDNNELRQTLRQTINARRAALSPEERQAAATGLCQQYVLWSHHRHQSMQPSTETTDAALTTPHPLTTQPPKHFDRVAGFIAVRGEIDAGPILATLRTAGSITCLPVIQTASEARQKVAGDFLKFGPYTDSTPMRDGQYRIPVPAIDDSELLDAQTIDLVLVPLVAFDAQGNRLGMGGGFYDRTFEYRTSSQWENGNKRQAFIGVAHDFQRVEQLPVQPWDVPLDAIITDTTCYFPAE